jgi:hypothetical protein
MYFDYYFPSLLPCLLSVEEGKRDFIPINEGNGVSHLLWVECKWYPAFNSTNFFPLRFTPLWGIPSILSFPLHRFDPCKLADRDIHDKLLLTLKHE